MGIFYFDLVNIILILKNLTTPIFFFLRQKVANIRQKVANIRQKVTNIVQKVINIVQ